MTRSVPSPDVGQDRDIPSECQRGSADRYRTCPHCGTSQDVACFKRRSRREGQRESWCRSCINAAERARRVRRRAGIIRDLGRHVRQGTPVEKTRAVVAATVERLGGVNAVAAELADLFQHSRSRRDSLSIMRLVLRLADAAE